MADNHFQFPILPMMRHGTQDVGGCSIILCLEGCFSGLTNWTIKSEPISRFTQQSFLPTSYFREGFSDGPASIRSTYHFFRPHFTTLCSGKNAPPEEKT